ncbi:hypothetical protein J5S49_01795 [Virgibacillus halodenitrificans]|uniref:hypothetical protein n=1 Tax=Virgibacillus halodenitrificans TaxID=1482 RepID=UPI001F3CD12D|nr:hypothetical protein [Virgibacillus halodenitrificans]MCG1027022.1 hypothetical protein [Virgibacillus halodenitrificans]
MMLGCLSLPNRFVEKIPESREQNGFMKTMDTFGEIGQDVWDAAGQRADKMTDSWYDFGNYFTFGAFDTGKGMYEGYMHRTDKVFDSLWRRGYGSRSYQSRRKLFKRALAQ